MTAKAEPFDEQRARADLAAARDRLDTLQAEHGDFTRKMRQAADAGDVDVIFDLQQRQDSLPARIRAARIAVMQQQIAIWEAELPTLEADSLAAIPAYEAAILARKQAEEAERRALAAVRGPNAQRDWLKAEIASKRRQIEDLLAEQSRDRGPVVRAAFLAGKGLANG